MAGITDWNAAIARLNALARGLPNTIGGVVELGKLIAKEENSEELLGCLVVLGSFAKIEEVGRGHGMGRGGSFN